MYFGGKVDQIILVVWVLIKNTVFAFSLCGDCYKPNKNMVWPVVSQTGTSKHALYM